MRILIFSQQMAAFRSGVGTYTHGLVVGLAKRGHQLTVVVPEGESVPLDGIRFVTVPRPKFDPTPGGWSTLGTYFARVLGVEIRDHDLVHFTDARESWRVRRAPIPTVGMANDSYALDWLAPDYPRNLFSDRLFRRFYYGVLRAVEKRTYRRLDALIANSKHVAEAAVSGYGLAPSRAHVVHIGLPEAPPVPEIPFEGSPSILFVGGNFQRKGLHTLLEAAARLRPDHPGLRVHVVGRDRNQPALKARARDLGLGSAVIFYGWQPNERVRGMMAGADLFALPSLTEGFGLVYLEAMQAGTPVVATSRGGAREVLEEGKAALFVQPCDVEGLAVAIRNIASDTETAARLRAGGRAAAKRFTVEAMAEATEALFLKVLGV